MNNEKNIVSDIEEIINKITSKEFDKLDFHCLSTSIPKKCLEEPCILGVDEAGRGPVLGPMVYAILFCPANEVGRLKSIGCTDSKTLTEKKREEIFGLINNSKDDLGWVADIISPNFISNKMQKRVKYSLNEIAQNSTIQLIQNLLENGVEISEIYVDTIGPPENYQERFGTMYCQKAEIKVQKSSEMKQTTRLSTGCWRLNEWLCGGLPVKGITEICGESGSGKSQLCMQLSLMVQYPEDLGGLGGGTIYISSEEHFSSKRLYQMIENLPQKIDPEGKYKIEFSNNLFILHVADYQCLSKSFDKMYYMAKYKNIKLLVLDSVAALFRGSSMDYSGFEKAREMRTIAKNFHKLCAEFDLMVVCVNQVSNAISGDGRQVPALGLAWANLVTTRIQLKKFETFRSMEVVFCPVLPRQKIQFKIDESGSKLSRIFPKVKVVVEKKADSLYPVVGAASICAKVIRDNVLQSWKFSESISVTNDDFGTGYPGDPKSKEFLKKSRDDIFGYPNLVRFSWSTATRAMEGSAIIEWEEDPKTNGCSDQTNISSYFSSIDPSGKDKHTTKCNFFKDRNLSSVITF